MELLYEIGLLKVFREGDHSFTVYTRTIPNLNLDVIGSYIDKKGIVKRIRRGSVWGNKIMELLTEPPPLEQSESQKRLSELIAVIGQRI